MATTHNESGEIHLVGTGALNAAERRELSGLESGLGLSESGLVAWFGATCRSRATCAVLDRLRPIVARHLPERAGLLRSDALPILADAIQDTGVTGSETLAVVVRRFAALLGSESSARFWIQFRSRNGQEWLDALATAAEKAEHRAQRAATA